MSIIGTRPLSQNEIEDILRTLVSERDKALFVLGLYTGFRISESLSLKWSDIIAPKGTDLTYKPRIKVERVNMKGSHASRSAIFHPKMKQYFDALYASTVNAKGFDLSWYVFQSRKGLNRPIGRIQAYKIFKVAVNKLGLTGCVAMHSTRKTFAERVYKGLDNDIFKTCKALGHKNISSTISYLSFDTEEIDNVILNIE